MSDVRHSHTMSTDRPPLPHAAQPLSDADMTRLAELVEQGPEFVAVRSVSEDVDALAGECIA
jgi:hypothetical protein